MEVTTTTLPPQPPEPLVAMQPAPQQHKKHIALIGLVVALLMAAGIAGAVVHSRNEAHAAATAYTAAAHKYLKTKVDELTYFADPKTAYGDANGKLDQVKSEQQMQPKLRVVHGIGASMPEYKSAKAYTAKIARLDKSLTALEKANDALLDRSYTYNSLDTAYISLVATQTAIYDELGTTNDPVGFFTDKMINPLTDAKATLAKASILPANKDLAKLINAACDEYIADATALRTMYQTNSLRTQQYSYPDLNPIYDGLMSFWNDNQKIHQDLRDQATTLATQAKQLASTAK